MDAESFKRRLNTLGITIYPLDNCTFGEFKGAGTSMVVHEGICIIEGEARNVAFKEPRYSINTRTRSTIFERVFNELSHEVRLMKRLENHPNAVQILGMTFKDSIKPILIVELGTTTLEEYLLNRADSGDPISWAEKIKISTDVLNGLKALHGANIVHGDLKGENILVVFDSDGTKTAKISDFGFSSTLSSEGFVGGTPQFYAPECTRSAPIKYKKLIGWHSQPPQDVFSYGLVLWQIAMNGKTPFDEVDQHDLEDVLSERRGVFTLLRRLPHDTPKEFRSAIVSCTKFFPQERAKLDEVDQTLHGMSHQLLYSSPTFPSKFDRTSSRRSSNETWSLSSFYSFSSRDTLLSSPSNSEPKETKSYEELREEWETAVVLGLKSAINIAKHQTPLKLQVNIFNDYASMAQNDPRSLAMQGLCYFHGFGTVQLREEAFQLWEQAAEGGSSLAQAMLGYCFQSGIGCKANLANAIMWYTCAANGNEVSAQAALATCYELGQGVEKDSIKAFELYQAAASQNHRVSQYNLGLCHDEGKGTSVNHDLAEFWYSRAAENGDNWAKKVLKKNQRNRTNWSKIFTIRSRRKTDLV